MHLKAEQLQSHLDSDLASIYVVSGDESLLVQEACDSIRSAARAKGFSDRELFETNQHFDWQQVLNEANSLSLFANKKILELRIPSGKPGKEGGKFFQEYCQNICADNLLLVIFPQTGQICHQEQMVSHPRYSRGSNPVLVRYRGTNAWVD